MSASRVLPLLERDRELRQIDELVDRVDTGTGGTVVIEAAAGMGKTALLTAARTRAAGRGVTALISRGAEIERGNAYGVVRQLFEPLVAGADPRRRARLLAGAAGLAAPLVTGHDRPAAESGDTSFAVLHGLYWLAANMAQDGPLLLAVDDAHWADHASLRYLCYLARRNEGLPIGLLVAGRPAESTDRTETTALLADLAAEPASVVLRPAALTAAAVGEIVAADRAQPCDPEFAGACHEVTGGTPFLVEELLRSLREQGTEPVAEQASTVRALGPPRVARHFLVRLSRLAPEAATLAKVVAVLGPNTQLRHAAEVAGLAPQIASMTADALAMAGIFADARPLTFIHPLVSAAIAAALPAGERGRIHLRAARLFSGQDGGAERAAAHLLAADPVGQPWVVHVLHAAARRALSHGVPDAAVTYLFRALAEPIDDATRCEVLTTLGFAQSYLGDRSAEGTLEQALALTDDVGQRVAIALALGRISQLAGDHLRAADVFTRAMDALAGQPGGAGRPDDSAELVLLGARVGAEQMQASSASTAHDLWLSLRTRVERHPNPPPSVFGALAAGCVFAAEPADVAVSFARRALAGAGRLLPEVPDRPPFFYHACAGLLFADHYAEVEEHLDRALADSLSLGALQHVVGLSAFRSHLHIRRGRLADAEADARQALSAGTPPPTFATLAVATLVDTLLERGDLAGAQDTLDAAGYTGDVGGHIFGGLVLAARGRLRAAQDRPDDALRDLLVAGDLQRRLCADTPAMLGWRSEAAVVLLRLGRAAEAVKLAGEELALARQVGTPRSIGIALRGLGLATGGDRGLAHLDEARTTLAAADSPVEHARALVDLGAALRRRGARAAARRHLADGLDLAHRHGSRALAGRARAELLAAGARPRRPVTTGVDALTASERRVALMAARGLTNREIAQALFVTARTVEGHLTSAFQKLSVTSRRDLPRLLGD